MYSAGTPDNSRVSFRSDRRPRFRRHGGQRNYHPRKTSWRLSAGMAEELVAPFEPEPVQIKTPGNRTGDCIEIESRELESTLEESAASPGPELIQRKIDSNGTSDDIEIEFDPSNSTPLPPSIKSSTPPAFLLTPGSPVGKKARNRHRKLDPTAPEFSPDSWRTFSFDVTSSPNTESTRGSLSFISSAPTRSPNTTPEPPLPESPPWSAILERETGLVSYKWKSSQYDWEPPKYDWKLTPCDGKPIRYDWEARVKISGRVWQETLLPSDLLHQIDFCTAHHIMKSADMTTRQSRCLLLDTVGESAGMRAQRRRIHASV